ncbi:disulfide bond formation protein B [Fodinicurvata sediminis]|uniref:disulfide bond formation protein B n=1 Tax=Fodinicurvata sediminis TaxID=1121832 RepID=UPI0003B45E2D|nr:disulfide bond formation protein B [Fodinicurvata sediminis]
MSSHPLLRNARPPALIVALGSALALGAALTFQYGFGYLPCSLCHDQRYAHLAALVLAVAALAVPKRVGRPMLLLAGLALLAGAGLAGYHVGIEQDWWQGPTGCTTAALDSARSTEEIRDALLATPVVRCDEVAWSLFGISMAGYNFLLSLGLAGVALIGPRLLKRKAS